VYHGHEATRELKELVRGYETLSQDVQRMMVRIKAIYRTESGHPALPSIISNNGNNGCSCSPHLEADSV
jgi:hypothetical protein